jgi:hypothetical protein
MPRMLLTEEEAALIARQRQIEDAHRGGWNKALKYLADYYDDRAGGTELPTLVADKARSMMKP